MIMKRAGYTLAAGFLIATGSGFLMLIGAGIAQAKPESVNVCQKLTAALKTFNEDVQDHSSSAQS